MINLLRSEWIKLRSVRSTLVLLVAAGVLVVFFAVIIANEKSADQDTCQREVPTVDGTGTYQEQRPCSEVLGQPTPPGEPGWVRPVVHLGDITVGVSIAIFLFGILGVQIIGQEYRFNTIRPTFTAAPRRTRVLIAKLIVVTVAAALVSAVMLGVCYLVGKAMLDPFEVDGVDGRIVWATMLFAMGWTAYGMGVGAIVRQPIAGIVILLIQGMVAEPLLATYVKALGPWVPFQNGVQMTGREADTEGLFRSPLSGGIYFFLFTTVLWIIGAYLVNKRDA